MTSAFTPASRLPLQDLGGQAAEGAGGRGEEARTAALTVVVPAYQEERVIESALRRLHFVLSELGVLFEVIVVCDGCTDATADVARSCSLADVTVVAYPDNRGKGHALITGARAAAGDVIAFFDGDLDLHPSTLAALLNQLRDGHADVVVGSKVHPKSLVDYPTARRLQSRAYRRLIRLLFQLDVGDTQTGAKIFRREVLDAALPGIATNGFAFDLELLVRAHDLGFVVQEAPVVLEYQFDSRVPLLAALDVLRDTVRIAWRRRASRGSSYLPGSSV